MIQHDKNLIKLLLADGFYRTINLFTGIQLPLQRLVVIFKNAKERKTGHSSSYVFIQLP